MQPLPTSDSLTRLELSLLGPPALRHAGRSTRLPPNDAALLAVLAIDGPTSRQAMADLLWPDAGESARNNLRQRLSRWRAAFGLALPGTWQDLLALPDTVSVDLHALDAQLGADATSGGQELLGGLAFDDNPALAQWVRRAREQWRNKRYALLATTAAQLEHAGRLAEALALANELVAADPLSEHAHRRLMRLHYLRGDRSAALAAFDAGSRRLADELGLRPSDETRELARTIERGATRAAASPTAPAPPPVALMRPPVLTGRAAEWQVLEGAARDGHIVLAQGEAGIGKTRLLGDFAASRGPALVVSARPGDADMPYQFLARLLRDGLAASSRRGGATDGWAREEFARFVPELGPAPAGRLEPVRLRRAVLLALHAWRAAGIVTLFADDLHFADGATLDLLLPCLVDAAEGWCILLAVRPNELPTELAGWLDRHLAAQHNRAIDVRLAPLGVADVAELLGSLQLPAVDALIAGKKATPGETADAATSLTRFAGGNPWFVMQTLMASLTAPRWPALNHAATEPTWMWPLPTQVGRLIEQRLRGLSEPALHLLRVAALAGTDFNATLAAEVMGCPVLALAGAWAELEAIGTMQGGLLAHDLWLEVAQREVPAPIARALHQRLAEALEARCGAPARMAAHWLAAEAWGRAAPHYRAAAALAFIAARPAEQLALLDQATDCFQRAGDRSTAFQCRLAAVGALSTIASGPDVQRRIQALLADAADDGERLHALLVQCKHLLNSATGQQPLGFAQEALALAQRMGSIEDEVAAAGWLGLALSIDGQSPPQALALLDAHAGAAGRLTNPQVQLDFFGAQGYVLFNASRSADAMAPTKIALALAERLGDLNEALTQVTNLALMHGSTDRSDESLAAYDHGMALWHRLGEPGGLSSGCLHMHAGAMSLAAGRFDEALRRLHWALDLFRTAGETSWAVLTEHRLAHAYIALGQPARARQVLSALADATNAGTRLERLKIDCCIDAGAASRGRLEAALASRDPTIHAMEWVGAQLWLGSAIDPAERAVALCRDALAEANAIDAPPLIRHAQVRLADALRRAGDGPAAAACAAEAVAGQGAAGRIGLFGLTRPEFWWMACQALAAGGRAAEAASALEHGVAFVRRALDGHVPPEFANSFEHRNPVNAGLLAAAAARCL